MTVAKTVTKIKKKRWIDIVNRDIFNGMIIGESCTYENNALIGRQLETSLMNLTNDPKRQNITLKFEVDSVDDNRANASIIGYTMTNSSIRRIVRRATTKIDESYLIKTADDVTIRLKPIMLTIKLIKGSVIKNLRKTCEKACRDYISKVTYQQLVNDLLGHKFQSEIRGVLKTIYPLRTFEIRVMAISKEKSTEEKFKVKKPKEESETEINAEEPQPKEEKEKLAEENKKESKDAEAEETKNAEEPEQEDNE